MKELVENESMNAIERSSNEEPFVSVIMPCRNEEQYIERCIESLIQNTYPKDRLEMLIVDGRSTDNTRKIIHTFMEKYAFVKLLNNEKRIAPAAMNIGIQNSKGEIIIRVDAHSIYPKDYIEKLVRRMIQFNADNVGGRWIILPSDKTLIAEAISMALSCPFGVGNAYYRIGTREPKEVDTVPFGCYKKEVFKKVGLFNESLVRNQDIELNLRIKRKGGKILLFPDIVSYYYARSSLKGLFKQNFGNGFWVVYSTKFGQMPFSTRHLVPLFFLLLLASSAVFSLLFYPFIYLFILIIGLYFVINILFSVRISMKNGFRYFIPLILAFSTLHFSYGIGSICGIMRLLRFEKSAG